MNSSSEALGSCSPNYSKEFNQRGLHRHQVGGFNHVEDRPKGLHSQGALLEQKDNRSSRVPQISPSTQDINSHQTINRNQSHWRKIPPGR